MLIQIVAGRSRDDRFQASLLGCQCIEIGIRFAVGSIYRIQFGFCFENFTQDAFDRLLAKGAPGYVPKSRIDFANFITTARASGAVAVLAHPLSLGLDPAGLEGVLTELAEGGLAGLECYYSRYSPKERAGLAEMARRHDLVATGGSDYHGRFKPDIFVGVGTGDLDVPDSALGELLARRPDTAA